MLHKPGRSCAFADWGDLPPNVCQEILCYDMETFFVGGSVCKRWKEALSGTDSGPVHMDFGYVEYPEELRFEANVPNDIDFVRQMLKHHACSNLKGLLLCMDSDDAEELLHLLRDCQALQWLELREVNVTNWWYAFGNVSEKLQVLEIDSLKMVIPERVEMEGPVFEYSLAVFNTFRNLEELSLQISQCRYDAVSEGWRESYDIPVLGDLQLPRLKKLDIHDDGHAVHQSCRSWVSQKNVAFKATFY